MKRQKFDYKQIATACICAALLSVLPASAQTSSTAPAKPSAQRLLELNSGRNSRDLVVITGVRGLKAPASDSMHALILIAGAYRNGIPQLKGVYEDAKSAKEIAQRMGVPASNITTLMDEQLTLEGMRQAFADLAKRVRPGDDVFIYYSGHGGRQLLQDAGGERCAESLVTIDGYGYMDTEMSAQMKQLSARAKKVVMFIDSCHSGSVTTRSLSASLPEGWVAKTGTGKDNCAVPTNVLTRSLAAGQNTSGSGAGNFVYIAAARADEISFDMPGKGGVATQGWLNCMRGQAEDKDGSGGISASELSQCAQGHIDTTLQGASGVRPPHVTLNGNSGMVLSYLEEAPPAAPSVQSPAVSAAPAPVTVASPAPVKPVASAPLPTAVAPTPNKPASQASTASPVAPAPTPALAKPPMPVTTAAPVKPAAPAAPVVANVAADTAPQANAPRPHPAAATLSDIFANRDDRKQVTFSTAQPRLKIDADKLDMTVQSREGGYLYVLMAGSDGETFDLLFPNQLDPNNKIAAGESLRLPRRGWQVVAGGPVGKNTLLAMVTDAPRDFSQLNTTKVGPFSVAKVNQNSAHTLQLLSNRATAGQSQACQDSRKRTLRIEPACSNSYGAALLQIEEVR